MSSKDKWVRRFSVDETSRHQNGFTIYKITSVLFPIESPEAVTVVSVWKRYSDVQRLHKSMKLLHAGLHLRGTIPVLAQSSYFKRFQQEVIEERAKSIKALLEFVAEHQLLFTSTDFVNFLQTGYPEPESTGGIINAIRSSLHLPIEETPPLEYQTDDDSRSPVHTARPAQSSNLIDDSPQTADEMDSISRIPIYEADHIEIKTFPKLSDSFESLNSLDSINSDLFEELNKLAVDKSKPLVKSKSVLPDLINFDAPSCSKFEDYHTMPARVPDSDTNSLSSNFENDSRRSSSRVSVYSKRSVMSLSNVESKTKTEDSYVFEAGYMLNLATRCENLGDYQRAFECYKSGIEKMLIGVQNDSDPQRRALIKEKTNKYITYAEEIYKNHLRDAEQSLLTEREDYTRPLHCPIPISMLKRPYEELSSYRVLAILGSSIMLVLHKTEQTCYAMKVIQKIPNNLTEFDEYFHQRPDETRQPILTTVIPYMVPLHAYVETNDLIFLILSYAPGEKLFDYIKNYAKSIPNTPARELNLENVFPITDNVTTKTDNNVSPKLNSENNNPSVEIETDCMENVEISVNDLVLNSKRLLENVDRVLCEPKLLDKTDLDNDRVDTSPIIRISPRPVDVLPPSAVCKWAAEILTALESLHNSGVVCRDLNPSNILLGAGGQIILTYIISYPGLEMSLAKLSPSVSMYIAPELYVNTILDNEVDEKVCDFWSFGAIMYELLCGVPLSHYHKNIFTSHTILYLPDGLSVEVESLLTQLLTYEPSERLGAGKDGIQEIKNHPYFKHIDWKEVYDSWVVPG
ncbi:ribosomal protein S6 kinase delta-1 [Amyelois transitella]|uniref:ribosomal protein S6 kinase delta-1 n=1 Tax=Amyelois transitella TaxID=680683 RepID=UPI00298FB02A|nr:ribosomal protein S6 kinase delta-1 [Amyelois transitella]